MYIAPGDQDPCRGCFVKIEFVCSTKCYGFELVLSGQFNFLKIDTINIKFSSSKLHNDEKEMNSYCHYFLKFLLVACCTGSSIDIHSKHKNKMALYTDLILAVSHGWNCSDCSNLRPEQTEKPSSQ